MKVLLLAAAFLLLAQQQDEPWTPAPGNPGHREPPAGWSCNQNKDEIDPSHLCTCHRTCQEGENTDPSEDGPPIIEDPQCTVYCHMKHCFCPLHNCP